MESKTAIQGMYEAAESLKAAGTDPEAIQESIDRIDEWYETQGGVEGLSCPVLPSYTYDQLVIAITSRFFAGDVDDWPTWKHLLYDAMPTAADYTEEQRIERAIDEAQEAV